MLRIHYRFSEELTNLHRTLQSLLAEKNDLERRLQIVCGMTNHLCTSAIAEDVSDAPSLTLRASPGQGMHVHVARKREDKKLREADNFVGLSESGSTSTFFHKVMNPLENHISQSLNSIACRHGHNLVLGSATLPSP